MLEGQRDGALQVEPVAMWEGVVRGPSWLLIIPFTQVINTPCLICQNPDLPRDIKGSKLMSQMLDIRSNRHVVKKCMQSLLVPSTMSR